jgi:DNA-3-methyladenine glycosylase
MASSPGIAYVYRSYGLHVMLNAVAHGPGQVGAVLIRALEPRLGLDAMRRRRGPVPDRRLCSGPGRLCQALGIGLDRHGHDLTVGAGLWLAPGPSPSIVHASGRIGVSRATELPLRFFVPDSRFVSGHRRGQAAATEV